MNPMDSVTGIDEAHILSPEFRFHRVAHLSWADGAFTVDSSPRIPSPRPNSTPTHHLDGRALWVVPGFVDAHTHLGWTDFSEPDREARTPAERTRLIAQNMAATVAAGFTGARDAGGLGPAWFTGAESPADPTPFISGSIELLTRESVHAAGGMEAAVTQVLEQGAEWVKLIATEGVASPDGVPLESHFSREEFRTAVRIAANANARVMVHAWGGNAITWAIEAGAHSIEHGIFLTADQAQLAAQAQVTYVPTLIIYRLVLAMIDNGELPHTFRDRVAHAVDAHPEAIRIARDAGLAIAAGTDFGTTAQHGTNISELYALINAGLSTTEVLRAATTAGAALLGGPTPATPTTQATPSRPTGTLEPGAPANAVVLKNDPLDPATYADPESIVAVIARGHLLSLTENNTVPISRIQGE